MITSLFVVFKDFLNFFFGVGGSKLHITLKDKRNFKNIDILQLQKHLTLIQDSCAMVLLVR